MTWLALGFILVCLVIIFATEGRKGGKGRGPSSSGDVWIFGDDDGGGCD